MMSRIFFNKLFSYFQDPKIKKLFKIPMFITMFIYVIIGYLIIEANEYLGTWLQLYFVDNVNLPGMWSIVISLLSVIITFFLVVFTFSFLYSAVGSLFFEKASSLILQNEGVVAADLPNSFFKKINFFFQHLVFLSLLTICCFILSFVPVLNILTTGLYVSYTFLSFVYSASNLSVSSALADFKKRWLTYVIFGNIFALLLIIPVANIFIFPIAVVFYTLLYVESVKSHVF